MLLGFLFRPFLAIFAVPGLGLGAAVVHAIAGHDFASDNDGSDGSDGSDVGNASLPQRLGFVGEAPNSRIIVGVAAEVVGETSSRVSGGSVSVLVGFLGRPFLARFACDGLALNAAVVSAIAVNHFDGSGLCGNRAGDGPGKHHAVGGFSLGLDGGNGGLEVEGADDADCHGLAKLRSHSC